MLDLHYWPTPNGKKVTILLEECEMPYRIVPCSIGEGDQFKDAFLAISPNNRMPAIVDTEPADGGDPIALFRFRPAGSSPNRAPNPAPNRAPEERPDA